MKKLLASSVLAAAVLAPISFAVTANAAPAPSGPEHSATCPKGTHAVQVHDKIVCAHNDAQKKSSKH